jgi:hypothetical protein
VGTLNLGERLLRMPQDRIVAVGLLTQRELTSLGPSFERAWPVDEAPCFSGLLQSIDDADRERWGARDAEPRV